MDRRRLARRLALAAAVATLGLAAVVAIRCSRYVRSQMRPARRSIEPGERARASALGLAELTLETSDGVRVAAWQSASKHGASVVLLHGVGQNRAQLLPEAEALAARGFGLLLLDFRAHGDTPGDVCTWGDRERAELRAAVDWLALRGDRIGVYGFSMGASVAAEVAAHEPRVAAVVLAGASPSLELSTRDELRHYGPLGRWAAFATFRAEDVRYEEVDVVSAIPALGDRLRLVVIGSADPYIPTWMTDQLAGAAGRAKLASVDGAGHGGYATSPGGAAYLRALAAAFDVLAP